MCSSVFAIGGGVYYWKEYVHPYESGAVAGLFALHTMQENYKKDHGSYASRFPQLGLPRGASLNGDLLTWDGGPYRYRIVWAVRNQTGSVVEYYIAARPIAYSNESKRSYFLEDANSIQIALNAGQAPAPLAADRPRDRQPYALRPANRQHQPPHDQLKPRTNGVILDPRDAANTPLDSHIWEDEDFEEEEDEVETAADRAIAAFETAHKEKEEKEKWMRRAEMQYPDPRKTNSSAAVTSTGSAITAPQPTTSCSPT